jgi:hypothetical protein
MKDLSASLQSLGLKSEHVYQEEVAEEIYRQVGDYWKLMDEVCRRVTEKVESDIWAVAKNKNRVVKLRYNLHRLWKLPFYSSFLPLFKYLLQPR